MHNPILYEFKKTVKAKQILELKIERENLKKAAKVLEWTTITREL